MQFDSKVWKDLFDEMVEKYNIQQSWVHLEPFLKLLHSLPEHSIFLEIGASTGGSARIFQNLFKRVITIDQSVFDTWVPDIISSSSEPQAIKELEKILNGSKLDAMFIDGDHSYESVRKDIELYSRFVKDGGIIGFHDTDDIGINPWTLKKEGGKRILDEIKSRPLILEDRGITYHGDPLIDIDFEWYDFKGLAAIRWKEEYIKKFQDSIYIPLLDMFVQKDWTSEEGFRLIKKVVKAIDDEVCELKNKVSIINPLVNRFTNQAFVTKPLTDIKKILFICAADNFSFYKDTVLNPYIKMINEMGFLTEILRVEFKWKVFNDSGFSYSYVSSDILDRIKEINPDLISGWENSGALWGLNLDSNSGPINIPSILGIPALFIWDNTLTQSVNFIGKFNLIKDILSSPNIIHFSHDKGDIYQVYKIFDLESLNVNFSIPPHLGLLYDDNIFRNEYKYDVSHCGNVYINYLRENPFPTDYMEIAKDVVCEKLLKLEKPFFDVYTERLKDNKYLTINSPLFWRVYNHTLCMGNTFIRLKLFDEIKHKIDFLGCYSDPDSADFLKENPKIEFHGPVKWGDDLAKVYRGSKINLIVSNMINQDGISPKLIECLIAGGFALIDPRPELYNFFGSDIDAITYRSKDELDFKINYFLQRESERIEIIDFLRNKIKQIIPSKSTIFNSSIEAVKRRK